MFHSGMGVGPALIMGVIISAVIGISTGDIRGFAFPMALFLFAALSDLFAEKKELENENETLKKNQSYFYEARPKRKKRKKKKSKKNK